MKQLSNPESLCLFFEKSYAPLENCTLEIYDPSVAAKGKISFPEFLKRIESRLDRTDISRFKLALVPLFLDYPYWTEDNEFDIERHVYHCSLPQPGDWRQLMIQISRLQSLRLDRNKPLWEIHVIDGINDVKGLGEGSFAIFIKQHQATLGSEGAESFRNSIHDQQRVKRMVSVGKPLKDRKRAGNPGTCGMLARSPVNYLRHSARSLLEGVAVAPEIIKTGLPFFGEQAVEAPRTIFNVGRVSSNRITDAIFLELRTLNALSGSVGDASIDELSLTIISGAMRKYLKSKGHLPNRSLHAACPDYLNRADNKSTNLFSLSLCSDIANPLECLRGIQEAREKAITRSGHRAAHLARQVSENLPAPLARMCVALSMGWLGPYSQGSCNTLITLGSGHTKARFLCGSKMARLMQIQPVMGRPGLSHTVVSYNGTLSITFTACREMLPDPAFYTECLEEAYGDLKHAIFPATRHDLLATG